jgi:hypothetical protein
MEGRIWSFSFGIIGIDDGGFYLSPTIAFLDMKDRYLEIFKVKIRPIYDVLDRYWEVGNITMFTIGNNFKRRLLDVAENIAEIENSVSEIVPNQDIVGHIKHKSQSNIIKGERSTNFFSKLWIPTLERYRRIKEALEKYVRDLMSADNEFMVSPRFWAHIEAAVSHNGDPTLGVPPCAFCLSNEIVVKEINGDGRPSKKIYVCCACCEYGRILGQCNPNSDPPSDWQILYAFILEQRSMDAIEHLGTMIERIKSIGEKYRAGERITAFFLDSLDSRTIEEEWIAAFVITKYFPLVLDILRDASIIDHRHKIRAKKELRET